MVKGKANPDSQKVLRDVLFELQQSSQDMRWTLSYQRLGELLSLSKEDIHRRIYSFRNSHPHMTLNGSFQEVDGDYLIDFLSIILDIDQVSEKFTEAGIFFGERSLYELRESFKQLIQNTIASHKIDKELILLLTAATIDFDDAIDSYLFDKFELDFFVRRSIDNFLLMKDINPDFGAEAFLIDYINALLPTKILNFRDITREFRERIFYELYGRTRQSKKKRIKKKVNLEVESLYLFFDLDENATLEELKKSFKKLIKEFHPDRNKNGEEMTKKVIDNYNKLTFILKEQSNLSR